MARQGLQWSEINGIDVIIFLWYNVDEQTRAFLMK